MGRALGGSYKALFGQVRKLPKDKNGKLKDRSVASAMGDVLRSIRRNKGQDTALSSLASALSGARKR